MILSNKYIIAYKSSGYGGLSHTIMLGRNGFYGGGNVGELGFIGGPPSEQYRQMFLKCICHVNYSACNTKGIKHDCICYYPELRDKCRSWGDHDCLCAKEYDSCKAINRHVCMCKYSQIKCRSKANHYCTCESNGTRNCRATYGHNCTCNTEGSQACKSDSRHVCLCSRHSEGLLGCMLNSKTFDHNCTCNSKNINVCPNYKHIQGWTKPNKWFLEYSNCRLLQTLLGIHANGMMANSAIHVIIILRRLKPPSVSDVDLK